MKQTTQKRHQSQALQRFSFKLHPVAAGCAVLIFGLADFASAQEAATNTVVVTGIRKGIEDAISVKKNSDSIVEAVSAEDIGKLPDTSIAESIARLPGLAAQRVAGRAQVISVRGLSPDFATTLLNGREQVSTGDNRSVEFDQYPSELLSGVTVYKTPDASLIGQGLSGTIDMQTVRPLDFPGRTVAVSLRGEKNSMGPIANIGDTGHRFSLSYIDQFADRTLGIAFGIADLESPVLDNETGTYEPFDQSHVSGVPAGTYVTAGVKSLAKSGTLKRTGVVGVLQYRPSKTWTSTLDLFASKFSQVDTNNQFEVNLGGYNGSNNPQGFNYTTTNIVNGTLLGGTATGAYPLVRGQYNNRQDSIHTAGWANKFNFGTWSLLADLNYSEAKRDETYLENNLQLQSANGGAYNDPLMNVGWATGNFAHLTGQLNYSDPTKLLTGNSIYGYGSTYAPHLKDELKSFKLVANLPVPDMLSSVLSGVDIGVNQSDRTKNKSQPNGDLTAKGNPTISSDLLYTPVNLGFAGSGIIPSWNVPGVIAKYFDPITYSTANNGNTISRAWSVNENITTSFVKANLDAQLGFASLRGNFGVQVVRVDQSSDSNYADNNGAAHPINDGTVYTDVLPSMNLVFGLPYQQTVRFGMAKQVARPRLDQLNSGFDFKISSATLLPGGSGGNSKLQPWRANAIDVSWEKYFDKKAYVAAAAYYKDLKNYIYDYSTTVDFSKYTAGTNAVSNFGQYNSPYNGTGGYIKGVELSASAPLGLIWKELDGFGVTGSATFTDTGINIPQVNSTIGKIQLPGMSKHVYSLTAYYEKNGFSARIGQRRRSDYVGEIGNFAGDRQLRYVVGDAVTDLQLGYSFEEGRYKGLSILLQVNNLTNAAYETYANSPDRQLEYAKYGRIVLLGASYKF